MWNFSDQSVVLEQNVLGQIRENYHITFALGDEEVWRNEKPRSIFARGCPSLKGSRTNPKIIFVIIDGVLLQRECLSSLGEDISYQGQRWAGWSGAEASLLVFAIDQGYKGSTRPQAECCQLCEGCQSTVW